MVLHSDYCCDKPVVWSYILTCCDKPVVWSYILTIAVTNQLYGPTFCIAHKDFCVLRNMMHCTRGHLCFPVRMLQFPSGKDMQMNLTGFLNAKNARSFIADLWGLLLSAMENIGGIPVMFLDQKKEEIKQRQVSSSPPEQLEFILRTNPL